MKITSAPEEIILDLAMLHHVTDLNARDFDFAAKGGRIDYFVDTNVYRFSLDPTQSSENRFPVALFENGARPAELALYPAGIEVGGIYVLRGPSWPSRPRSRESYSSQNPTSLSSTDFVRRLYERHQIWTTRR